MLVMSLEKYFLHTTVTQIAKDEASIKLFTSCYQVVSKTYVTGTKMFTFCYAN